jgi:hypothetical protein
MKHVGLARVFGLQVFEQLLLKVVISGSIFAGNHDLLGCQAVREGVPVLLSEFDRFAATCFAEGVDGCSSDPRGAVGMELFGVTFMASPPYCGAGRKIN